MGDRRRASAARWPSCPCLVGLPSAAPRSSCPVVTARLRARTDATSRVVSVGLHRVRDLAGLALASRARARRARRGRSRARRSRSGGAAPRACRSCRSRRCRAARDGPGSSGAIRSGMQLHVVGGGDERTLRRRSALGARYGTRGSLLGVQAVVAFARERVVAELLVAGDAPHVGRDAEARSRAAPARVEHLRS